MLGKSVVAGGLAVLLTVWPVAATPLVTAEESQLPADDSRLRIGIERGVDVIPIFPSPKSGSVQSPFNFRVKFHPTAILKSILRRWSLSIRRFPRSISRNA